MKETVIKLLTMTLVLGWTSQQLQISEGTAKAIPNSPKYVKRIQKPYYWMAASENNILHGYKGNYGDLENSVQMASTLATGFTGPYLIDFTKTDYFFIIQGNTIKYGIFWWVAFNFEILFELTMADSYIDLNCGYIPDSGTCYGITSTQNIMQI